MIRLLLIIQVPHASYMRRVSVAFRPIDRFPLRFKGAERLVGVVFHNIFLDMATLGAALGARFNVNVRHALLSRFGIRPYLPGPKIWKGLCLLSSAFFASANHCFSSSRQERRMCGSLVLRAISAQSRACCRSRSAREFICRPPSHAKCSWSHLKAETLSSLLYLGTMPLVFRIIPYSR